MLQPAFEYLTGRDALVPFVIHEVTFQTVALGAPLVLLDLAGRPNRTLPAGFVLLLEGVAEGGGQSYEGLGAPGLRLGVARAQLDGADLGGRADVPPDLPELLYC